MNLVSANALMKQSTANAQYNTGDIYYPVFYAGAAVEAELDQLDYAAKRWGANKDGEQIDASRARQWERQRRKSNEVHLLVAALRRRGRLVQGLEHRATARG